MPLTNLSKGGLIALIISLVGCQTVQQNTVAVSQTDVTSDRVSSSEPNLTDVAEPSLSDEAMYDPLAIVRELGEAIDSPNVTDSVDENAMQEVDNLVKSSQIEALDAKIDELMLLQKDIAAKLLEEKRKAEVQAKAKKSTPKPKAKPAVNPLKFP